MHIATSLKTDKKGDSSNFESVNDKGCSTSETLAEGKDDDSEDYVFLVCEELALTKYYLSTCRVKYDSSSVLLLEVLPLGLGGLRESHTFAPPRPASETKLSHSTS